MNQMMVYWGPTTRYYGCRVVLWKTKTTDT